MHQVVHGTTNRHEITVLLPYPFDKILSSVSCMELLYTMRFCCITENFTKSAQFWSRNVPLVLTKKTSTTLYVSDHKQWSYWSLKLPNYALFSPLLHNISFHKRSVHTSLSPMSISACVFLTGKQVTRPWYSLFY